MNAADLYEELMRLDRAVKAQREKAMSLNENIKASHELDSAQVDKLQQAISRLRDLQAEYSVVQRFYVKAVAQDNGDSH